MKIIQLPEHTSCRDMEWFREKLQAGIVSGRDVVVPFRVKVIEYGENGWGCRYCGVYNGHNGYCIGCGSPQGNSVVR